MSPARAFAAALATVALAAPRAEAISGMLTPPEQPTRVLEQRMVAAIGGDHVTLWTQLRYEGRPSHFLWVLATPAPVRVDNASPDFFDWLEDMTRPEVHARLAIDADGGGSFGCGAGEAATYRPGWGDEVSEVPPAADRFQGTASADGTSVFASQDTTDTLAALRAGGVAVTDEARATIDAYLHRGWYITVLRLVPQPGETQTRPLRVRVDGTRFALPLRMAATGASTPVELLLWVVAEARQGATDWPTVTIDERRLRWYQAEGRSNYEEVFEQTIADQGGRAFITELAQPVARISGLVPPAASADYSIATQGQPSAMTLTRLRTRIVPALLDRDLTLAPSDSTAQVSRQHWISPDQVVSMRQAGAGGPLGALALVVALVVGRRARRRAVAKAACDR